MKNILEKYVLLIAIILAVIALIGEIYDLFSALNIVTHYSWVNPVTICSLTVSLLIGVYYQKNNE